MPVTFTTAIDKNVSANSYSGSISSSVDTVIDLFVAINSHTDKVGGSAIKFANYDRPISSYSKSFSSSNYRSDIDYNRRTESYSKPISSFIYNERTSLELLDYVVDWDDESAVWYTPWTKETKILGSEDTFVVKSDVVEGAKEPAAKITVQYDATGNGRFDEKSDVINVGKEEKIHEVDVPLDEDGYYRMKIEEYSGYNSLRSLNMGIVH